MFVCRYTRISCHDGEERCSCAWEFESMAGLARNSGSPARLQVGIICCFKYTGRPRYLYGVETRLKRTCNRPSCENLETVALVAGNPMLIDRKRGMLYRRFPFARVPEPPRSSCSPPSCQGDAHLQLLKQAFDRCPAAAVAASWTITDWADYTLFNRWLRVFLHPCIFSLTSPLHPC